MDSFVRYASRYSDRDGSLVNAIVIASQMKAIKEIEEIPNEQIFDLLDSTFEVTKMIKADKVLSTLEDVLEWSRRKVNMRARRLRYLKWEGYKMILWKGKTNSGRYDEHMIRKRVGGILFDVEHIMKII